MDFCKLFLVKLLSGNKLTSDLTVSQCLPPEFPIHPNDSDSLLSLIASGSVSCCYPYRYEIADLPCLCIIYTVKGSGVFETGQKKFSLTPGTFLFTDCTKRHKIYTEKNSWNFYQLFLEKTECSFFFNEFTAKYGNVATISGTPYILSLFCRLTEVPKTLSRDCLFINHRLLTNLLTAAVLKPSSLRDDLAPPYLREMKKLMDTRYASPHSLTKFEETLRISRYRLSREFRNFYMIPPLQYLNKRRIEEAVKLLQDPSMAVYEAGRLVGIDNTTHFIRLFRKYTGTTPANYKNSLSS